MGRISGTWRGSPQGDIPDTWWGIASKGICQTPEGSFHGIHQAPGGGSLHGDIPGTWGGSLHGDIPGTWKPVGIKGLAGSQRSLRSGLLPFPVFAAAQQVRSCHRPHFPGVEAEGKKLAQPLSVVVELHLKPGSGGRRAHTSRSLCLSLWNTSPHPQVSALPAPLCAPGTEARGVSQGPGHLAWCGAPVFGCECGCFPATVACSLCHISEGSVTCLGADFSSYHRARPAAWRGPRVLSVCAHVSSTCL